MRLSRRRRHYLEGLDWYVLRVAAKGETAAGLLLKRLGYTAFVPTVWRRCRVRRGCWGKATEITRPMLMRYVLLGTEATPPWHTLLGYPWIEAAIGVEGRPLKADLKAMRHLFDEHVCESLVPRHVRTKVARRPVLRRGARAEVTEGLLVGQLITVGNLKGSRVEVVPKGATAPVAVTVPVDNLELID